MALFLVSSDQPQPALAREIDKIDGAFCWWENRAYFVPFAGSAQALTLKLIEPNDVARAGLLVVRVEPDYYGFGSTPRWEELATAFREQLNG